MPDMEPIAKLGESLQRILDAQSAEIKRLRAENERLRAALQAVRDHGPATCSGITPRDCLESVQEIARAALEDHQ